MINDFNQAIHWGKYRQYMGKAAGALHNYVNGSFLMKNTDTDRSRAASNNTEVENPANTKGEQVPSSIGDFTGTLYASYQNDVLRTNVFSEWMNGNHISFYVPAETQTKIFLPDNTMFRTDQEKNLKDVGGGDFWSRLLNHFGIVDINQSAGYGISLSQAYALASAGAVNPRAKIIVRDAIDILTAGINSETTQKKVYDYLQKIFIIENPGLSTAEKNYIKDFDSTSTPTSFIKDFTLNGQTVSGLDIAGIKELLKNNSKKTESQLDSMTKKLADERAKSQSVPIPSGDWQLGSQKYKAIYEEAKENIRGAFNVQILERFYKSGPIQQIIENNYARSGAFQFNEWEVPMLKVDLDPKQVTINAVSVSMGNVLAKIHLQMQDEPSYQHIGGKDSYINISMTVTGEKELVKIKRLFDHISTMARLEHATGVLGFMGVKNIITALSGIKYVMPLNYSVATRPNYPHVYDVQISLVDFDIFQQTREKLDSNQQKALIDHFQTKRNPFLRIKQMWGSFNAYPDFPLQIKNQNNEVVGHLDPDFYFRSFQMFDDDVIYNTSKPKGEVPYWMADEDLDTVLGRLKDSLPSGLGPEGDSRAPVIDLIVNWISDYNSQKTTTDKNKKIKEILTEVNSKNISMPVFLQILQAIANETDVETSLGKSISSGARKVFITDFIDYTQSLPQTDQNANFTNKVYSAPYQVGNISSSSSELYSQLTAALSGQYNLDGEDDISFDPDSMTAHCLISMMPIRDPQEPSKIPAVVNTAYGVNFGYIDLEKNGRFYLTVGGVNVKAKDKKKAKPMPITDTARPERAATKPTTFPTAAAYSSYQPSMSANSLDKPEVMGSSLGPDETVSKHWEKMLVDARYRDVSGRMLRAFPTYMLWLIDEGGYFAGVKLFDNFYGLQSIIDFSVVSSEDLLGDTLVFRVSNLYSKLTKRESEKIFGPESQNYNQDNPGLTEGLSSIIDNTLNKARNILSHMKSEYVVDINNIRLKPGVRVHLRGGYGSNPNSLQTLFNGTITEVQAGDIITITAQSDAIELGATVNTTNKKGDTGKIDGGINTGLWLSEPRDLMVRLLSMGTSRFREGISYASRGLIFSENKFGIRHFGSILYEPLNALEQQRHESRLNAIADAHNLAATVNVKTIGATLSKQALQSALYTPFDAAGLTSTQGFRSPVYSLMNQMWANFSAQRDLEIFKRNIYPGNGTGIAQFLGGDLGDGWTSVSSITPEEAPNQRLEYLAKVTDQSWNNLVASQANKPSSDQKKVYETLTSDSELLTGGSAKLAIGLSTSGLAGVVGAAAIAAPIALPVAGVIAGAGLLGVLAGRGGTNMFRAIGLLGASDDDDMPGFDEVSFRAQTYMRTVWDLFQVCAKLLPNYIVAVRPFEDRSTVFYGKPHWLYTSGVIPVTTGYPGDDAAAELGIIPPQIKSPDLELMDIMTKISQESSSYADAEAFLKGKEPVDILEKLESQQQSGQGVFGAAAYLRGKIINLASDLAQTVVDPQTKKIIAKLPTKKGYVKAGVHLPIGSSKKTVSLDQFALQDEHEQIPQLPTRYSYPFHVNSVDDDYFLANYSYIDVSSPESANKELATEYPDKFGKKIKRYEELAKIDSTYVSQMETGAEKEDRLLSETNYFGSIMGALQSGNILSGQTTITMPFPEKNKLFQDEFDNIFDFNNPRGATLVPTVEYVYDSIDYSLEWLPPQNALEEQFYIAMRWPYYPQFAYRDSAAFAEWKKQYFTEDTDLSGMSAEAYKNVHVLVYNPTGNNGKPIGVVCKPSYFLWGYNKEFDRFNTPDGYTSVNQNVAAVISPDAAYYLGVLDMSDLDKSECIFAFVPKNVPLGVVTTVDSPITFFESQSSDVVSSDTRLAQSDDARRIAPSGYNTIIGFGAFKPSIGSENFAYRSSLNNSGITTALDSITEYSTTSVLSEQMQEFGGNYKGYLYNVLRKNYDKVTRDAGYEILNDELTTTGSTTGSGRVSFTSVYNPFNEISLEARKYYDEDFDSSTSVIAGNGRTLQQAEDIWDQFRFGFHTYSHVEDAFFNAYGLDPTSEEEIPEDLRKLIFSGVNTEEVNIFKKFGSTTQDEFSILLGENWRSETGLAKGVTDYATDKFIDADIKDGGVIEYFNMILKYKLQLFYDNFISGNIDSLSSFYFSEDGTKPTIAATQANFRKYESWLESGQKGPNPLESMTGVTLNLLETITTPKQLFLLLVGLFRQKMWATPYARAWLVLKPNRKMTGKGAEGQWDFTPVTRIFAAFIEPNNTYGKDDKKFLELLYKNRGEGSSSTNIIAKMNSGIDGFLDRTIGPLITAAGDALTSLVNMFKLNMLQMGYGLSQVGTFAKQANILNKVLNDSIYYSMGRPGSLLRAVDNPFTREYGEPVVEIREPFQRIHYLSSFSHIMANQIQETTSGVSTVVTAVSDGKYPVTVALDKGASAERQVEMTVETGIYFDNAVGSGLLGFLHPILHPWETGRGISKFNTGAPDELSAKRIALSHLKESVKDIYGGELLIIGNGDIRPHDLVYLADVYERMYGIFEVEQVVHHFTPDLGYVTAITPNALVTVNDPARWYMSSWIHSWFSLQDMRNSTRIYMQSLRAGSTGVALSNEISVDALAETLLPQLTGAIQYTQGSSALISDITASTSAQYYPDLSQQAANLGTTPTPGSMGRGSIGAALAASAIPVLGQLTWKAWQWVRDNLADQHGCYVQYLNKNGQPMDGGLSYNQGMVVGRYHSKALLPGVLGSRVNARTVDGHAYIRTDDLFKSLGWKESDISSFVRYSSYENALVHAQVLGLSGLGPEKASMEPMFRVICKLDKNEGISNSGILDGDTIQVKDVLSGASFRVRFDGINAKERSYVDPTYYAATPNSEAATPNSEEETQITPEFAIGNKATAYTSAALKDRTFVLRIAKSRNGEVLATDVDFEAGQVANKESNYLKERYGRVLGTIFYKLEEGDLNKAKDLVYNCFTKNKNGNNFNEQKVKTDVSKLMKSFVLQDQSSGSSSSRFTSVLKTLLSEGTPDYSVNYAENDPIKSPANAKLFSALVEIKILDTLYDNSSKWPFVLWNEYYNDGTAATLNWELVALGYADVFTDNLLNFGEAAQNPTNK